MSDDSKFSVMVVNERNKQGSSRLLPKRWAEPAEAADVAEAILRAYGEPGQTYAELRLNGDVEPHTCIYFMEDKSFGVWNTDAAKWPLFYNEGNGTMLEGDPFADESDGISDDKEWTEDGFGDEDPDSEIMDLGGTDDEEEDDSEPEEEEWPDAEDDPGDEGDSDADDEADDDESDSDDSDDDEDSEDDADDEDDDAEDEDQDDEGDLEEDSDGEIEGEGDNEGEHEHETEDEMPRIKLFAKMRGPLGWRKRAESEELEETNKFEMVIGKLDTEAEKTKDQEDDSLVRIAFAEDFRVKDMGLLVISVPPGTQLQYDEAIDVWTAEVKFN